MTNMYNQRTGPVSRLFGKWFALLTMMTGFLLLGNGAFAQVTVSGALTGNGSYTTLGAAITAIGTSQSAANIVVTITGNTTEGTSSISIGQGTWATMTIKPSGGSWTISAATTAGSPMIDFNGADNITIDGLNTGGNALTITNTTASATSGTSTIRFQTDAINNTITNCSVLGSANMAVATNGGNIWFGAAAVTTGNDGNTISNCNIGPAGANLPTKCIYFSGSSNIDPGTGNSGNTITGNNIFDYFSATVASAGIDLNTGTPNATITNNKFYQTGSRTQTTGSSHRAISINNTAGNGYTITGNTIGYASSAGTGTYTFVGVSSSSILNPIFISVGTTTASVVSSNIITNIAMSGAVSGTSSSAPFRGIYVAGGLATCNSNTIGSMSATGAITFTSSSASASDVIGLFNFGSANWITNSNNIGGITASNSSTGASNIYGIRCNTTSTATWTCNSNTIGGTVANSINSTSTATGTIINGILNSNPIGTFTSNIIQNLTTAGGTGTGSAASVVGIAIAASSANHTLTSNTIYNLTSTLAGAGTINGINFTSSTGTNVIERNLLYHFDVANSAAAVNGIYIIGGTATYKNNMIRLGNSGNIGTLGASISGINETTAGIDNIWNNSIYIGGAPTSGAANSFAFQSTITTNTRAYQDNIFYNARSNNGSTGKHYAIRVGGTAANPAGLTSNYNILYAPGSGGNIGLFNAIDQLTLAAWRTSTGQDANSNSSDPQFIAPTATTPNLHINPAVASAAEGAGILIASVVVDFDNETRSGLTPTDIGADAFNGTPLPLCTGTPASSTINGVAAVCSGSGTTLTLSTTYTDIGITYQWASSTVSGGPYSTLLGTSSAQATGNLTATTYYICTITCSNSGLSTTTVEKSVVVNPLPTVSVTPTSASYCTPGGSAVALTASGASTYAWSPSTGLSATTGASVNASPSSTTTYTVTGTDGNGCTNTATSVITAAQAVIVSSVTATPSSICSGGSSQLLANAYVSSTTAASMVYAAASSQSLYTITSPTTVTTVTSGSADDGYITVVPASFSFSFLGTSYTSFGVGTNGYVVIGGNATTIPSSILSVSGNVVYAFGRDGNLNVTNAGSLTHGPAAGGKYVFQMNKYSGGATGAESATIFATYQIVFWGTTSANPGRIEIIYGTNAGTPASSGTIGLKGAAGTFINGTNGSTTTATTSAAWPVSGTMYSFSLATPSSFSWTPTTGLNNSSISNPVASGITSTTTYNVTASQAGCSGTGSVTITIASGAPTVSVTPAGPVSLCGAATQVLTATATGGGQPYAYAWTLNGVATGTNSPTLTTSGTGNYQVTVTDACSQSGVSNTVSVTNNAIPTATAGSNTPVCTGATINLTSTTNIGTSFSWTGPGGFTSAVQNPSIPSSATTNGGAYTVTITSSAGCTATANTTVVINNTPGAVTVTPATSTICSGASQTLTASGGSINSSGNATLGTASTLTGATTQPSAFVNRWSQYWGQTIYTAAELTAAGLTAGSSINSISYTTTTQGDANNNTNFSISIGNTASSTLSAFQTTGLTTVFGPATYTHAIGVNTITFTTPFVWNGTSNIIIDQRHDGVDLTNNAITLFTAAADNKTITAITSTLSSTSTIQSMVAAATVTPTTSTSRLNIVLAFSQSIAPTWSWSPNTATTASVVVSPTVNTTYTATATSSAGCTATGSATVNVSTVVITGGPTDATCNGSATGSINFSASGGTAPYTYTVNGNPATSPLTGLAAGSYLVVATGSAGCTGSATYTVGQPAAVVASGTPASPTCFNGTNGSIVLSATGGNGSYTFTLNGNPATSPVTGLASGTYSLVAFDGNNCASAAVPVTISNPSQISISASNDGPVCDGGTINLTATPGSYASYSWSGPNAYTASGATASVSAVAANAGTYTVLATDANGCTNTASTTISVTPLVTPAVSLAASPGLNVCSSTTVTFTATPTNGGAAPSYNFFVNGVSVQNGSSASYAFMPANGDSVYVVLTSNANCASPVTASSNGQVVSVTGAVAASVSIAASANPSCVGSSVTYTATQTGGGSTPNYEFFVNGVSAQNGASATYSYTPVNGDAVYVVMTSSFACATGSPATSSTINQVVNATPAAPVITASAATICAPGTITLSSSYTGAGNVWSPGGATTASISVSGAGTYTYTVTYTDATGCVSSASAPVTVTIYPANTVSITPSTPAICAGGSVTLISSQAIGNVWSTTETTSSIVVSAAGPYSVVNTDANGCSATATVTVIQNAVPTAAPTATCTNLFPGRNTVLTANATAGSGSITGYQWVLNGTNISGATAATYTSPANAAGSYTVIVTNSNGCSFTSAPVVISNQSGPLSGTYTIAAAGCNFSSIATAATYLSANGVSGPVTFNVAPGLIETAPVGGITINMCSLAAGLKSSAANPVIFQKSGTGTNPKVNAWVGTTTTLDGIIVLVGADYITFDGIDVAESAGNTTATTRMEYGYALFKCSGNDGSNYNTIKNCTITLNKTYNASTGIFSNNTTNVSTLGLTYSGAPGTEDASRNGHNSFYGNTITNVYNGVYLIGNSASSPNDATISLNDTLNSVGIYGTGNNINNFGGLATVSYGVWEANQRGFHVHNNTIVSGSGTTTTLYGIYFPSGVWGYVSNNSITLQGTSTMYHIYTAFNGGSAANPNILRIDSNIIQNSINQGTGTMYGIYGSSPGGTGAQLSVSNNTIRNYSTTSTGACYGIYYFASASTGVYNCKNNTINNNVMGSSNTFYGIYGYNSGGDCNWIGNTITSNTLSPTSGTSYLLYPGSTSLKWTVQNNTITNNVKNPASGASGTTYCIYSFASSTNLGEISGNTVSGNNISGVTGTSVATIYGFYNSVTSTAGYNIFNNSITNLSINGTSTGTSSIFGTFQSISGVGNVYNNTISGLTSSAALTTNITGAQLSNGAPLNFYNQNICSIAAGGNGVVRGIQVTGGTTMNVYNNAVGGLSTNANPATAGLAAMGIDITGSTASNISFNTITMNGTVGGANAQSATINASTTPTVSLRNNILINTMNGGIVSVYRRSSTTLTSYASNSNNNLFYVGSAGANNNIYYDGTNTDATVAAFKTRVSPRDGNSASENVGFLSSTCGNANFLHVQTTSPTLVEGGAVPIAGITTDIDGQTRSTTSPDIGADENTFINAAMIFGTITISPNTIQCTSVPHTVTADITPGSAGALTSVTLNYTFNGVAQPGITMTNTSGITWSGTIPVATPVNATVVYSVTAVDAVYTKTSSSGTYSDSPLTGSTVFASASPATVCAGTSVTLKAFISGAGAAPTTYGSSSATSTADEEIFNVTLGTINQTSNCATVAPGAGSVNSMYSNYTGLTPTLLVAGTTVPFSLTLGYCGSSAFSNMAAIYIDYNRDGLFTGPGETVYTKAYGAQTYPSSVVSGSFVVPSSGISVGYTRMRIVYVESSTISPTGTYTWGETEDYTVQLAAGASTSWSDGTSTVGSGSPLVITPSATTTYTATLTDANGCTINSPGVVVTVNPIPAAPTATNSTQCGVGVPKAKVAGGTAYNWYLAATGGSPIQSSTADTLTSYSISATTTFYVSSINASTSCEGSRTAVVASVSPADSVSITPSVTSTCLGTGFTLTAVQTGSANTYVYTWNGTPAGSGVSSGTSGNPISVTPTASGAFTYTVTATDAAAGCVTTATGSVTIVAPPAIDSVRVSPTAVCSGSLVTLNAYSGVISTGPQTSLTYTAPGTTISTSSDNLTLVQFGSINNATTTGGTNGYVDYTGTIAATTVTSGLSYNLTVNVMNGGTEFAGAWFDWNRNGVFDASEFVNIPVTLATTWNGTVSVTVPATATAGVIHMRVRSKYSAALTSADAYSAYTYGETEEYLVNVMGIVKQNGALTYSWSPGGMSGFTATANPVNNTASPAAQVYTVLVTNPTTGCTNTGSVSVTVNPLPVDPTTTNSTQCGTAVPTASVSGGAAYNWYLAASGGTPIQSSTASTLTSYSISSTTTFYVSSINTTTSCESARIPVTATVTQPDSVVASASAGPYCLGTSVTLTATQNGSVNNYTFTWNGTPVAGSGIPSPITGSSVTVTPTAAGTYTYKVTAVDATAGCTFIATVPVTFSSNPVMDSVKASPSTICAGSTVTLSAYSGVVGSGPQTMPSGYGASAATSTADEEILNVTFASINQSSTCTTTGGPGSTLSLYSDYTATVAAPTVTGGQSVAASFTVGYCSGTAYSNILAVYIDYNRNGVFTDAGELVFTKPYGAAAVTGTAYPATIVIPTTATAGVTRMRVVLVESSVVSPTGTYTWGETEDYKINIQNVVAQNPAYTYTWTPGGFTGATITDTPSATTTYSVTATNAAGCSATGSTTVTVNPLPTAPVTTNSTQCGFGVPTASVSGGASYKWYLAATGGSAIQSSASATLSSYVIYSTTTFYVSSFNTTTGCESPRSSVVATVTPADSVAISAVPSSLCLGSSLTLTATNTGSTSTYSYSWNGSPTVGSGLDAVATLGPLSTLYFNDFSSGVGAATLNGSASLTSGKLQLTPNTAGQLGGITVTGGSKSDYLSVDFDMSVLGAGGADGMSYSFGNDVSATATVPNAEDGTGTKLKVAFDSYGAMPGGQGIYLMYNNNTSNPNSTDAGVLAYSSNATWVNNTVHVTLIVNQAGKATLSLNGTPVFTNIQLPAAYLSANKATWNHVIKARTGALSEIHAIDNLNIQTQQYTSVPGNPLTITPTASGTYVYTVNAVDSTLGCHTTATVSVVVNPLPDASTASASASTICQGSTVTLSATPQTAPTGYPASAATSTADEEIFGVSIGTLNNTSNCSTLAPGPGSAQSFYSNYTTTVAAPALTPGQTYPLSLDLGYCSGTAFSNMAAVYIDYNRNGVFTDAGEQVYTKAYGALPNATGSNIVTGSVTIPATASAGLTRMRVVFVESSVISSAGTYTWGETEDYVVNLVNNTNTVSWYTGSTLVGTGSSITITPGAGTTAYYAVITSSAGCSTTSSSVSVTTVTNAPPVFTATPTTICNSGTSVLTVTGPVSGITYQWQSSLNGTTFTNISGATATTYTTPTLTSTTYYRIYATCGAATDTSAITTITVNTPFITGTTGATACGPQNVTVQAAGTGTMTWYNTSSGGTALGTGNSFTTFVSTTSTLWVEASIGTCLSAQGRQPVTVTINPAPAISASGSPTTFCAGGSSVLTVSSANASYTYTWNGGAGSGSSVTVSPTTSTVYTVTAIDGVSGCQNTASVSLTVNALPVVSSVTATPSTVCVGGTSQLNAVASGSTTAPAPTTYCAVTNAGSSCITNVTFASINRTSVCDNTTSYYYSVPEASSTTTVFKGQTYPFSVTCNGTAITSVWIDYNRDGVYSASEWQQVYLAATTGTINITIPATAATGKTGMRVRSRLNGNANGSGDACLAMGSGETEDYTITMAPNLSYAWSPAAGLSSTTIANPVASVNSVGNHPYTVVVTDGSTGCSAAPQTVTVVGSQGPSPIITPGDTTLCYPNEIYLHVVDTGLYSGGYPTGTVVDWIGIVNGLGPNDSLSSTISSSFQVLVTLPSGCQGTSSVRSVITRNVAVSSVTTAPGCTGSNGKIVASVTSGTAPFRFIWKNGSNVVIRDTVTNNTKDSIFSLSAGNYTLEVFDLYNVGNGCTSGVISYNLPVGLSVALNMSSTPVSCHGSLDGTAHVTATGGTGTLTYLWNTGATTTTISALSGGTYTVTVTDGSGCSTSNTVSVYEPAAITANLTLTKPTCPGGTNGSIVANIVGGTHPYQFVGLFDATSTFIGDSSASGLSAGTYQILVSDSSNCTLDSTFALNNPAAIAISGFTPTSGQVGDTVIVSGISFTPVTALSFNGTAATYVNVLNDSTIKTVVPTGATTGTISVTSICGTATSTGTFTVIVPSFATFNLKGYIEGYYLGSGTMQAVFNNIDGVTSNTLSDTIRVELRDPLSPATAVNVQSVIINTSGQATISLPASLIGNSYYIAVFHRSTIETWSALPVTISSTTSYDFTTASSKAYDDGINLPMKQVELGVWAFYSGDINQDGTVDASDMNFIDNDASVFAFGYNTSDINGDGATDAVDMNYVDNNSQLFLFTAHP